MVHQIEPRQNQLLAALPPDEYQRLLPHLDLAPLPLGRLLYPAHAAVHDAYFPIDSIVSLLYRMPDGTAAEIALVGHEGMVGTALLMGGMRPNQALVQGEGHAYRLDGAVLKAEFDRGGALQRLLLRYIQAMLTQMAQTVVCNGYHSLDQQLCRWLLLSLDCLPADHRTVTGQLIADMLGLRHDHVSAAADKLQSAGLIRQSRGHITVLDRFRLEQASCECYAVVKKELDRLLPAKVV